MLYPKSIEEEIRNLDILIASLPRQPRRALSSDKILHGDENDIGDLLKVFLDLERVDDTKDGRSRKFTNTSSSTIFSEVLQSSSIGPFPETTESNILLNHADILIKDKDIPEEGPGLSFLQFVDRELADLDAPKATRRQLKKKYEQYLKFETKSVASCLVKGQGQSEVLLKEAQRRQKMLSSLLAKEVKHGEILEKVRQQRRNCLVEQCRLRERRMHSAHVKHSRNDAAAALRKADLAQKSIGDEVLVLKELCEENLVVRKTRLMEYLKDDKQQKEAESARVRLRSEAVGKFYQDQLSMLAGSLETEVTSLSAQEKAQSKLVENLKREQKKVRVQKSRILLDKNVQKAQRDVHRRELDAQRLKEDLWKMP